MKFQHDKSKPKLPYGSGSIQWRGGRWWLVYRGASGHREQINSHTTDALAATRMLLERVMANLQAEIRELKEAYARLGEGHGETGSGSRGDHRAARDSGSRAHPKKPAPAAGAGGKNPRQRGAGKGEAAA